MSQLLSIREVIHRVVAARVRDRHTVEDLVQDTLVRVAAVEARLNPDELRAYAIVTARNLVVDAARRHARHERHAHRLVDYTTLDGPEQLALDHDEAQALAVALGQLDPIERDLLLSHEVDGRSTQELGDELGVTPGGIAMRLARARARLRLEFVLAYRQTTLPTSHCRRVLLAMSAGDHRRQRSLHAGHHLLGCATCAELAEPVTRRRRGIASWLIVPVAEAVRLAWLRLRSSNTAQITAVVVLAATVVAGLIFLAPNPSDAETASPASVETASTIERTDLRSTLSPVPSNTPTVLDERRVDPARLNSSPPSLPECPPNPLADPDPSRHRGCNVPATEIIATEVLTDEGFVATTQSGETIWVELVGPGESPVEIDNGTRAVITGTITDPDGQPADRSGQIACYVEVAYNQITLI